MLLGIEQLTVLGDFAAAENGPGTMLQRGFGDIGVVLVPVGRLAAPGERPGQLPARRDFTGVKRAGRPALLVDARLQLLGIFEMAPTAL